METLREILKHLEQDCTVTTDFEQFSGLIQQSLQNEASEDSPATGQVGTQEILALVQTITWISTLQENEQIARFTAEQMLTLMHAQACSVFTWDQNEDTIQMIAFHSVLNWDVSASWYQPLDLHDFPLICQVLDEKKVVQAPIDACAAQVLEQNDLQQAGIQSVLLLPLVARQNVMGLVEIFDQHPVQSQSEHRLALGQLLANQAAVGFEQTRILETFQRRAADLEAVYQAGLNLTASLELKKVLHAILNSIFDLIKGTRHAHIFLYEGNRLNFGAALWQTQNGRRSGEKLHPNALQYRVAKMGRAFVIPNGYPSPFSADHAREDRGAVAGLPLKIGTRVVGVMTVSHERSDSFSSANLRTLRLLGDQAAIAIENAHLHDLVNQQAHTDSLTGLPNRRAFDARLNDEIRRASRYQHPFTLVMLDLNAFKQINDTYGHPAGDDVLKQIAERLRSNLRDTDFLARYGGDEFAILMPETGLKTAQAMADRLANAVAGSRVTLPGADPRTITLSMGLATYPLHAISATSVLIAADQALYQSKAALHMVR